MLQRHVILGIAAVAGLGALIASAPAQAGAQINHISLNSLTFNHLTLNALVANGVASSGADLEQLNGVAVVGITLPAAAEH